MITGVLASAAVIGTVVLIVVLFLQRGREGVDLGAPGLLRLYLYVASLAGIIVLTVGLGSVVNYGLARAAGTEFVYGGDGPVPVVAPCPPGATGCKEPSPEEVARSRRTILQERDRQRDEDLLRGATFAVFGAIFWGAHWSARRGLGEEAAAMTGLRRGYLMLGTVVFGIATIVLVPTGVYQALAYWILPAPDGAFREGASALGGAIVTLPVWLIYLRLVVTEFRRA